MFVEFTLWVAKSVEKRYLLLNGQAKYYMSIDQ
jgi:hypothetical protein